MAPISGEDVKSCEDLLTQCEMFEKLPPNLISAMRKEMETVVVQKNEILDRQGAPCDRFYLLESGDIKRKFVDPESGRKHVVEFAIKAKSINSMRVIEGVPLQNTVKCVSNTCKMYEMKRENFLNLLKKEPDIAVYVAAGLCEQVRIGSKKYATPFFEFQQQDINMTAVVIAAGIESYYRSALNAMLNARLTGIKADLFPNMHIQVPLRISYIGGFKGLRATLDKRVDPEQYAYPQLVRLAMAIAPGIIMTPISSVLEASNAGHMNPEPMATRWMRGVIPRGGREIIFGIGLNQMSDYFEERLTPFFPGRSPMLVNAAGSLAAGVVSGYFSHVPHNMSTYKLLEPHRSYAELCKVFVDKSVHPIIEKMTQSWPSFARQTTRALTATLFPRGLLIRTTQIVGSFMILNGAINYLQLNEYNKMKKVLATQT